MQKGFTLVELVVVIVIVGILAATVVPRFTGQTGFEARGLRDETAAALRYAQKSAIAARRLVCVDFAANGLTARIATSFVDADCAASTALQGPKGGGLTVSASGGASYSSPQPTALNFTPLGQPSSGLLISVSGVPDLTVEAETGYVH